MVDEKYIIKEEKDEELEEIKRNPYNYICNFFEERYPHMGGEVFKVLSLVPCSLIMPPLKDDSGKVTSPRISYLLLSPPGTAKTSISHDFEKLCFNPFHFEDITSPRLASSFENQDYVTIITSDIARIFRDIFLIKLVENIIGDEGCISRFTKKTKENKEKKINAVGYFSGTPNNLSRTITDGILFRVAVSIIFHTEEQHDGILKKVNNRIGKDGNSDEGIIKEEKIINFYQLIKEKSTTITSFNIPEYFRKEIEEKLIPLFKKPFRETEFEFIRELNQTYKYMCSHAVLNIFNRKIQDGKLILEKQDLDLAIKLTEEELKFKTTILKCTNIVTENKLRTVWELDEWAKYNLARDKKSLTKLEYKILRIIIRSK